METQMFGLFIQEREHHRQALRGTGQSSDSKLYCLTLDNTKFVCFSTGLFEVRVHEYLDSIHGNEHRRVNKFLKGLGKDYNIT